MGCSPAQSSPVKFTFFILAIICNIAAMLFRNVIGQQAVKQHLVEMVAQNRLSHALLFLGREGGGALPLALAFANYVSLVPDTSAQDAGGLFGEPVEVKLPATPEEADAWMEKQPSYLKASEMVHPDIHYSYPTINSKPGKPSISTDFAQQWREFIGQMPYGNVYDWLQFIGAENKQGNITAQECNEIIRKLNLKSFESGYKILVMWMPEFLGTEANKLLKLIEEPPPDTLFILVAENDSKMLTTVLSRCQLIRVPAIDNEAIEKQLLEKANLSPEKARMIAGAADGSYREALDLLNHAGEDFLSLLRDWLNACLKNDVPKQVKLIEEISRLGREKQKQLLRHFIQLIEQALRLQVGGSAMQQQLQAMLTPGELDFASRLNRVMDVGQKNAVTEELDQASYHVERNANAKILFHALTIKIYHIVKHNVVMSA